MRSAVFLLKKEADSPTLTGMYERRDASGTVYLRFDYQVVRVWKLPVETLLAGGLATLPLAPIADVSEADLPLVLARMSERIKSEPDAARSEFWTATLFLMGTRYTDDLTNRLLKGMGTMFELTTYNAAIEKGLAKGISEGLSQGLIERERRGETSGRLSQARKSLLALEAQLGVLPAEVRNRVLSSDSLEGLDALFLRGVTASSWSELFPA